MTPDEARELFAAMPGVIVRDDPSNNVYPLATEGAGRDEVFVGRIRQDVSIPDGRGLAFWVVSDNLRKGAATNAVEIAMVLLSQRLAGGGLRAAPSGSRDHRGTQGSARRHRQRGPCLRALPALTSSGRTPSRERATRTPRSSSWARGPARTRTGQGRPFVGAAGTLLEELLGLVGWRREEVFITNVVKCRPPGNRDPEPDEMAACRPFLERQLEVLDPALVVTLGRFSLQTFMPGDSHQPRPRHRARRSTRPRVHEPPRAYAMYHPAAALRQASLHVDDAARHGRHPRDAPPARASRVPRDPPRVGARVRSAAAAETVSRAADRLRQLRSTPRRPAGALLAVPVPRARPRTSTEILRVIPLGGIGEIGKNMTVFEFADQIVIVDCGLMFPEEEMYGIDLVVPDVAYLRDKRERVKAFVITHAHEDHVGGLPYVLPEFPGVPVYASRLARGLLGNKFKEHKSPQQPAARARARRHRRAGHTSTSRPSASATPSPTPWACASARPSATSSTPATSSSTTRPVDGKLSDFQDLARFGEEGVLCLMSDSTRAENPGYTPSERTVGEAFRDIMEGLDGRVIVATFASNIARIQQVFEASETFGRQVAVIGRSMEQNTRIATDLGYLVAAAHRPRAQGPHQGGARRAAHHRHDRRPGRAHGRPGAHGQSRPPLRRDRARRHRHRQRQPHPRQRGVRGAHGGQPLQGRRQRLLPRHQARPRLGPREPGRAQADAQPDEAALRHPHPRRVPDARPARPAGCRGRRRRRRTSSSSRTASPSSSWPTARRAEASVSRPATSTSTASRSARSATSSCATGARSPRTACSSSSSPWTSRTARSSATPEVVTRGFVANADEKLLRGRRGAHRGARSPTPGEHLSEIGLLKAQIKDGLSNYLFEQTRRRPLVFPVIVEV